MPRHVSYQLQWSSLAQEYIISHNGKPVAPRIEPAGQRWFAWLEAISSFSFQSRSGETCTVRKERVQRGGSYWYAYRRRERRMAKRYLARNADLSLAQLEMAATLLNRPPEEDALTEMEADVSSQLLLASRLHLPRLPAQHVSRPRLLLLLERGVRGALTLVSAPAGSGKTTLLAEWAATSSLPVAWLSLEAADNDPLRFLSDFRASLAGLDESINKAIRVHRLTDNQSPERALVGILNELTNLLRREAVVILDDYHLLTSDAVHALLRFLLDHLPVRLHLVIGTRVDPPLPLARLRAQRQLQEVHADVLRFVVGEVEALVQVMGLTLSNEATSLLEQHTEGWIAGIQLLALALPGQADATTYLRAFRGTHRFLLDYVSEEILAQQSSDMQRFLLCTCVLERMTGSLCEAVTALPNGQRRLATLEHANLFVSALDDTDTWYRYHALFANSLRAHLQKWEPELMPELYLRASRWYEQHQGLEEACDYAFLAGDLSRAAHLVAWLLPLLVEQGRFERLGRWISQLPPALIATSPQLYIAMPWMYALNRHSPEYVEQILEHMELHMQKQQQNTSASWVEPQSALALFRALTALSQNKLSHAFMLVREAMEVLTSRETALSQLLAQFIQIFLSITYGANGDLKTAERILRDLRATQLAMPFSLVNLAALFLLGELYKAQGQLRRAGSLYESLFQIYEPHPALPPMPLFLVSFVLMRRSALLYEWGRLSEAASGMQLVLETLPRAIGEVLPHTAQPPLMAFGLWMQARIDLAQGRSEATNYFLTLIRNQPGIFGELPQGKDRAPTDVPALTARLALSCGQLEDAVQWADSCGVYYDDTPVTLLESQQVLVYLTLARVLIARGRIWREDVACSQALILLDHWRDCALRLGFTGWFIEIQMLTALALQVQGKMSKALATLGAILAQAEAEGYVRLFVDEGQPMAHLLARVSAYTTASPAYIQRLQSYIPSIPLDLLPPVRMEAPQLLLNPLSSREREVLSLLAAGASNQQIADHLVISLNTAKRHVKHILAKLAATNRTQAVVHARDLHLL